jgi:soluble lytic murein transglycosylase
MRRLSAVVAIFVFCASFAPPVLVPGTVRAQAHAPIPLPDRNPIPNRIPEPQAVAVPAGAPTPAPQATAAAPAPVAPTEPQLTEASKTQPAPPPPSTTIATKTSVEKPAMMLGTPAAVVTPPEAPTASIPLPERNPEGKPSASDATPSGTAISVPPQRPKMDFASVLKPLLSYELSTSDEANLKNAFSASYRGDDAAAHAAADKITDPAAKKLAIWHEYRSGDLDARAEDIEAFRLANQDWPGQEDLRERAEIALFVSDASPEAIKAFFANVTPTTGGGKAALASAFLKDGNQAAAREHISSAWREYALGPVVEKKILSKYGAMLTKEDHQARIDKLLFPDSESSAEAALRISKLLPEADQKKIAARIAVVKRRANADNLFKALPASATDGDVGLLYNRIQYLRRKDRDEEAWKMLLDAPDEPTQLIDPDGWWEERRLNCRIALNANQPRIAYDIAAKHGLISGDAYVEANFLAGWIALRFLNEPNTALQHFHALRAAAKGSKSIALAEYWLGRTALALGDAGTAAVHFHGAAKFPQYYYGQLGRQALDPAPANLTVTPTPLPTEAEMKSFLANDAVRAIGVARASGMNQLLPQFFLALSRRLTNPGEMVLLIELARLTGNTQIGLRAAKIAFNRDVPIGDYALPVGVLPDYKSLLTDRVDPALVHALSRQESEFNAGAKSPVGASGFMQLMPATARAVARSYKVKFIQAQLTNPTYNIQLGEAHLRDLIDSYRGSYIMTLAAYNAGGGRVQEWVRAFGDPRKPEVDPIDWVERIPFTETREYVLKIMEALQLYRSRLAGSEKALQLLQDLNRGRQVPLEPQIAVQATAQ